MRTFRKIVLRLLAGAFGLELLFYIALDSYYWSVMPKTPDVQAARTYELDFHHGSVRYVSQRELRTFNTTEFLFFGTGSLLVLAAAWGVACGEIPIGPTGSTRRAKD